MLRLNHKKLDVWQLAIKFVSKIYKVTSEYPREELYGLTSQSRRAAVSVSANIAEGAARKSLKERKRFFEISRSSLVEVDTHLEIAKELNLINEILLSELENILNELFAKLSNLIEKAR